MSITTYSELKTAVANWLDRSDLTSRIPEFITLAEARINYGDLTTGFETPPLRSKWNESTATLSATAEAVALPSNFLEMRAIYIEQGSDKHPLQVWSAENQIEQLGEEGTNRPTGFSIDSDGTTTYLRLSTPPDATYTIKIRYFNKLTAFSNDADSNSVLTNTPGVYLHATLTEAYLYTRNLEMAQLEASRTSGVIKGLNQAMLRQRYGAGKLAARPTHGSP